MPDVIIERFLTRGLKYLFVCELNATRQFAEMLRARYTATLVKHDIEVISITKDDGLPFTPGEIEQRVLNALAARNWTPEEVTV
jgi:pyruvate/2-oxoacid:ferredoxin oxidoreductase alpha subunit